MGTEYEVSKLCDEFDELITIIDIENYGILYLNRACISLLEGRPWKGEKCYRVLQGLDEPCSFCPFEKLGRDSFYIWEFDNTRLGRHVILKDKLLEYEGRTAKLEIAIDITEKENLSKKVKEKLLGEEALLECISTVTCCSDLSAGINRLLEQVALYYRADRAYIIESSKDGKYLSNTYEWCAAGVESQASMLQNIEIDMFRRWKASYQSQSRIFTEDVEQLKQAHPTEYRELKRQNVKSLAAVPLIMNNQTIGFIGLDNLQADAGRFDLLEPLSYFLANEIYKRRLLTQLEDAGQDIELQNERFRILQEIGSEIIFEYLFDGDTLEYRSESREHTGRVGSFFRKNIDLVIHPKDIPGVLKIRHDVERGNGRQETELRIAFKEGKFQWHRMIFGTIYDKENRPIRAIGRIYNINELKNRQELDELTLMQMQTAINRTYSVVLTVGLEEDKYCRLYCKNMSFFEEGEKGSYTRLARRMLDRVYPNDREKIEGILEPSRTRKRVLEKGQISFDVRFCGEQPDFHWYEFTLTRLDGMEAVLLLLKNCDSKKMIEENLREALKNAQVAGRAKTEFLSRMSHDIRTPLNGIIGMTRIARNVTGDWNKIEDCLNKINISSEYLLMLINNVLDMSRIESGKAELYMEPVSVRDIIRELTVIYKPQMEGKQIELTVEDNIKTDSVIGDRLKITQVLSNLLSNACKYVTAGGHVKLCAKEKRIGHDRLFLHFSVEDDGPGISEEFQKKLFDPFERERDTAAEGVGTGLGLSICKNLVDMMQGHISVFSRKGHGCVFEVDLPAEPGSVLEEEKENRDKTGGKPDLKGKRVLLAEDNSLNAEIAVFFLEEQGILVDIETDGRKALERFAASGPGYYDAILMDIMMPVMDGLTAADKIRRLDREDAQSIPIIAMTANAFKEDITKAMAHGMNDHIAKPLDCERMNFVLARWLLEEKRP